MRAPARFVIRKEGRTWTVRDRGEWKLSTSYWWLAVWTVTGDMRVVPDDRSDIVRYVQRLR